MRPLLLAFACFTGPLAAQQPAPAPLPAGLAEPVDSLVENLTTFDPATVRLAWTDHHWQLVTDERVLKVFGRREADARQALRLIQELGLSQRGIVGTPAPVMEYWLAQGQAPRGLTSSLRTLPIELPSLRAEQVQAQWCLRDNQRILFNFGPRPEEARRALAIIRKYSFTQIGVVGQAAPAMMVFLQGSDEPGEAHTPTRIRQTSARQPQKAPGQAASSLGVVTPALPALHEGDPLRHAHQASFKDAASAHVSRLAPSLPGWDDKSEYVPLDWRQVQVRDDGGSWKLVLGGWALANFGADEPAARLALAAVRHYHFTECCRVGRPEPVFSYFLVNGQAPRGVMFGLAGAAFQPDKLSVQPLGREWAVCEGDKVLLLAGDRAEDARELLGAIQRFHFDRLCRIGESMALLVRVH